MKFFLDTASLKDISWAAQAGLIDGITTNPSLLSKQAGDLDPRAPSFSPPPCFTRRAQLSGWPGQARP